MNRIVAIFLRSMFCATNPLKITDKKKTKRACDQNQCTCTTYNSSAIRLCWIINNDHNLTFYGPVTDLAAQPVPEIEVQDHDRYVGRLLSENQAGESLTSGNCCLLSVTAVP